MEILFFIHLFWLQYPCFLAHKFEKCTPLTYTDYIVIYSKWVHKLSICYIQLGYMLIYKSALNSLCSLIWSQYKRSITFYNMRTFFVPQSGAGRRQKFGLPCKNKHEFRESIQNQWMQILIRDTQILGKP